VLIEDEDVGNDCVYFVVYCGCGADDLWCAMDFGHVKIL